MIKYFGLVMLLGILCCTDEEGSRRALDSSGFSDIVFTGFKPYSCGDDDNYATGFRAVNPKGVVVEGVVCCGLIKSCTVRF